jgi:hypothetical protein
LEKQSKTKWHSGDWCFSQTYLGIKFCAQVCVFTLGVKFNGFETASYTLKKLGIQFEPGYKQQTKVLKFLHGYLPILPMLQYQKSSSCGINSITYIIPLSSQLR